MRPSNPLWWPRKRWHNVSDGLKQQHPEVTDWYVCTCLQVKTLTVSPDSGLISKIIFKKETHVSLFEGRGQPNPVRTWRVNSGSDFSQWASEIQGGNGVTPGTVPLRSSPFSLALPTSHLPQMVQGTGAWGFAPPSCTAIWLALFFVLSLSKG